ncbi:hypothetical protein, partial [Xanthomonas oryzae]|uniref:hypothetical protein n=1 Tax=Xanthomonas oryzae TaxID=347 RepID=UPI000ACC04DE
VLQNSGPSEPRAVTVRGACLDGAWVSEIGPRTAIAWNAPPRAVRIGSLPVAPRLTGLHGSHVGSRPGQGGDFRDIQPFVPGDEPARAARRPGDFLGRRDDALSDSSVVLAIDTAEDVGAAVAGWGSGDPDRSGVTSLDLAREAALAIATAAIGMGDRVAYHALSPDGVSLPSGGGARHLARLRRAIAATGIGTDPSYRRSPVVPPGSIVFVLSTFVDGVAARQLVASRPATPSTNVESTKTIDPGGTTGDRRKEGSVPMPVPAIARRHRARCRAPPPEGSETPAGESAG